MKSADAFEQRSASAINLLLRSILIAGFSVGWCAATGTEFAVTDRFVESLPIQSWAERRDMGLAKQQFDYSCGAASLISVLTHYYSVPADELDIIDRIGIKDAFSMTDLARVAEEYGFKPVGLALDYENLIRFRRPVIVYLDYWDNGHFSVLRAIDSRGVWLADPAWGNTRMPRERFERFWRTRDNPEAPGRALVLLPRPGTKVAINDTFLAPPEGNAGVVLPPIIGY